MNGAMSLEAFLQEMKFKARLIRKGATRSTLDACEALAMQGIRVPASNFIKAIVARCHLSGDLKNTKMALLMVPGPNRLDLAAAKKQAGAERLFIPSPGEAETMCGYPRGGTPPLGTGADVVVIDKRLLAPPRVLYGGGGDVEHVLEIHSRELYRALRSKKDCKLIVARIALAAGEV